MSMKKQVYKLFAPFSSIQPPYGYPCKKQYEKTCGIPETNGEFVRKEAISQRERKLVFAKNIKKQSLGSAEMLMHEILLTTSQVPTIYQAFCFQIVIAALNHHQQDVRFREGKLPIQCLWAPNRCSILTKQPHFPLVSNTHTRLDNLKNVG